MCRRRLTKRGCNFLGTAFLVFPTLFGTKNHNLHFLVKIFGGFSEPFLRFLVGLTINELHSTTSSLNFTGNAIYVGNTEDMYI